MSGISEASGISSVAMLSTFIGLPVSIPLGVRSLAGASISGVTTALTKNYQKKQAKVMKLATLALAVFEISISKAMNHGGVDKLDFATLQTFHSEVLNELANVDHKMEAETGTK